MATLLGTPYERGKSDVVVSRLVDAPIEEGKVVFDAGKGKVAPMENGKTPFGVMGQNEVVGASVVLSGLGVWALASEDCVPVVGGQVHVTDDGLITSVAGDNTATACAFASEEVRENGVVENVTPKAYNKRCVKINMLEGF